MQNDPPQNPDIELPSSQTANHIKPISVRSKDVIQPLSSNLHASISNPNTTPQPIQATTATTPQPIQPVQPQPVAPQPISNQQPVSVPQVVAQPNSIPPSPVISPPQTVQPQQITVSEDTHAGTGVSGKKGGIGSFFKKIFGK